MKHTIESMQNTLFWKLRRRVLRISEIRYISVSEYFEWAWKYAPKTLKKDQESFCKVIHELWGVDDQPAIADDEYELERYNECVEEYFGVKPEDKKED